MFLKLWIMLHIWRFAKCSENKSVFREFHEILQVETYVLYDLQNDVSLVELLPKEVKLYPCVLLTSAVPWELKVFVGKRALSLVFVGAVGNEDVLKLLKSSLNRWHLEIVVFIAAESLNPLTKWLPLFEWCHANGFFNTLIMGMAGSSWLSYDHFLTHQVFETSLTDFLDYRKYFSNSYGFPIRLSLGNNAPRALVWYDADATLHLSGYYLKALQLFASHYNASLEYLIMSPVEHYTEWDCLEYIGRHSVDVCGDAMFMSPGYIITSTEEISHSFLVVPYDKPLERFYYFLKPFDREVWICLLSSLLYQMLTLSFMHRVQRHSWNFSLNFSKALLSLLNLPFEINWILSWHRRPVEILMIVAGFVVANWYLSILSSLLFTRLYTNYINSLEDLAANNISIMISKFEEFALNTSNISPLIRQQLMVVDNDELLHNRRNLVPTYAYYSQYDKNAFYLHQQLRLLRPRMKELTHIPIQPIFAGIPMRPNWPLEEKLNHHMSYLLESGIYKLLLEETADDAIRIGYLKYFPKEYNDVEPLRVEYFQMPGALLVGGYTIAVICFMLEVVVYKLSLK